jgi:hypothetical protein
MNDFWDAIRSLAPTVLVGLIFWQVMYVILRADKHERKAYSRIEAEERAKWAAAAKASSESADTLPRA